MKTKIYLSDCLDKVQFQELAQFLLAKEIVCFPTETVYGLGVDFREEEAIEKLYEIKKRPKNNPMILHISDLCYVQKIASDIPASFYPLAQEFFPGPLTIVLKKQPWISEKITKNGTIALRMPDQRDARNLIQAAGGVIVGTSANMSGYPNPYSFQQVKESFEGKIAAMIDGGDVRYKSPSTVIQLFDDDIAILREGPITKAQIYATLNRT